MTDFHEAPCLSDRDRPDCKEKITQVQDANGVWRPLWCSLCNLAWLAREEKERCRPS